MLLFVDCVQKINVKFLVDANRLFGHQVKRKCEPKVPQDLQISMEPGSFFQPTNRHDYILAG